MTAMSTTARVISSTRNLRDGEQAPAIPGRGVQGGDGSALDALGVDVPRRGSDRVARRLRRGAKDRRGRPSPDHRGARAHAQSGHRGGGARAGPRRAATHPHVPATAELHLAAKLRITRENASTPRSCVKLARRFTTMGVFGGGRHPERPRFSLQRHRGVIARAPRHLPIRSATRRMTNCANF